MCGIAGAFFVRDRAFVDRLALTAGAAMAHRGPDDAGSVRVPEGVLVHRRLAILDTSPAGHQPFASSDGQLQVIHNGEIYNYLELREELRSSGETFSTDTDTEVLLAAYRRWGVDAVARFNGIWAFAVWDARRRCLLLSRDRLGVKPLYIVEVDGGIAFASEVKVLAPLLPRRRPRLGALRDYAWHGLVDHADATFYEGIDPVAPGSIVEVTDDQRRARSFWSLGSLSEDADPRPRPGDDDQVAELGRLLADAIRLQLRSDVPLGTCLSGGLDSGGIVALSDRSRAQRPEAHAAVPRIALTASFPGSPDDESRRAASVAATVAVEHRLVRLGPMDLLEMLDTVLREQDEPFISSSILAQREVMAAASAAGVKVMLDGQGADELLAGYPHYRYPWLLGLLRAHPVGAPGALRALRAVGIPASVAIRQAALIGLRQAGIAVPLGQAASPPSWLGPTLRRTPGLPLRGGPMPRGTPLARQLWQATVSTSLPALLRYEDRNSMRFGVEARVPYLDHLVVEASHRLPDRLKLHDTHSKVALRALLRGMLPDEVRLDGRKRGFPVPQVDWLEAAMPRIAGSLRSSPAIEEGFIDRDGIETLLGHSLTADGGSGVWRALSLDRWLRQFA